MFLLKRDKCCRFEYKNVAKRIVDPLETKLVKQQNKISLARSWTWGCDCAICSKNHCYSPKMALLLPCFSLWWKWWCCGIFCVKTSSVRKKSPLFQPKPVSTLPIGLQFLARYFARLSFIFNNRWIGFIQIYALLIVFKCNAHRLNYIFGGIRETAWSFWILSLATECRWEVILWTLLHLGLILYE